MIAHICVTKKAGVFDGEAERVKRQLESRDDVTDVIGGKYFRLDLRESDPIKAKVLVEKICEGLLASGIYESYEYTLDADS